MADVLDLIIIGGGPVGLYANQYALKKGMKVRLIEKAPELGGKLKSIYPENRVYNVGGMKSWRAGHLIDNMISQTEKYIPDYCLDEKVNKINFQNFYVVAGNRVPKELEAEVEKRMKLKYLGKIDYDKEVEKYVLFGKPLLELPALSPAYNSVKQLMKKAGY